MNEINRRLKRVFLAACAALALLLPFVGVPAAVAVPAQGGQQLFNSLPEACTEPKTDMDGAGTACAGKAAVKPADKFTGGRDTGHTACLKALAAAGQGIHYIRFTFSLLADRHFFVGLLACACHGSRAPPQFIPQL